MERKNAWNTYGKREISELEELNSNYIDFLSDCKTERECAFFPCGAVDAPRAEKMLDGCGGGCTLPDPERY